MDFSSHIFCRKDVGAAFLPGLPVRCIVLEVDGPTSVKPFPMILPTAEPKSIDVAMIAGWLAALNGPCVEACAMSASQRETLLTLVCGYRAFLELPPGVTESDFYTLAHKLIDAAFELGVLEPADKKLRDIADWLEATLPAKCFLPILDDSYEARDPENRSKDDMTDLMAAFASLLDPHLCDVMQGTDLGAVLSTSSTSQSSTASRNRSRNLRKKARKAARKAAELHGPLNTTPGGPPHSGAPTEPASVRASDGLSSVQLATVTTASANFALATRADPAPATRTNSESTPFIPVSEATAPITSTSTLASSGVNVCPSAYASHTCVSDASTSEGQGAVGNVSETLDLTITQHAITVEEVPDIDAGLRRAPVLDADSGKGKATAVLERISDEDADEDIPGLVDVEDSSDGEDDFAYASEVFKVMRAAPFVFKQY